MRKKLLSKVLIVSILDRPVISFYSLISIFTLCWRRKSSNILFAPYFFFFICFHLFRVLMYLQSFFHIREFKTDVIIFMAPERDYNIISCTSSTHIIFKTFLTSYKLKHKSISYGAQLVFKNWRTKREKHFSINR